MWTLLGLTGLVGLIAAASALKDCLTGGFNISDAKPLICKYLV